MEKAFVAAVHRSQLAASTVEQFLDTLFTVHDKYLNRFLRLSEDRLKSTFAIATSASNGGIVENVEECKLKQNRNLSHLKECKGLLREKGEKVE